MHLGEKLRQARQSAGLSQRQLCGNVITRNMLSQIENGTARPSMTTLQYLARQLDLPVSYFLEEDTAVSSNSTCMDRAWAFLEAHSPAEALQTLNSYRSPDPFYDRECTLLRALSLLELAEQCIASSKDVQARQLLRETAELEQKLTWLPEIKNRRVILQGRLMEPVPKEDIPNVDEILLLRARMALVVNDARRASELLDAVERRDNPFWCLLRGRAAMDESRYADAVPYLQQAESSFPSMSIPLLEQAFREQGDFKMAYFYACKTRNL